MSVQNELLDDLPAFSEHENDVVGFESDWNLERQ